MSEAEIRKNKLAKILNNTKPEANDGDIENFYSLDPSNIAFTILFEMFRQA